MSFAALKKNSKSGIESLKGRLKEENSDKKDYNDDRYWTPSVDKSGNGFAVIRFLPAPDGEEMPYVKMFTHGFKVGSKWFIENCPTTIGQKCACCDANSELWNTELKENQDIVRKRKRQQSYHSNIMVINDPKNPDNDGKVFLFRYGAKIFQKIMESIQPEFEDETPMNPFDLWSGADFKLKIRMVEGYRNYDKSEFSKSSALLDGDDVLLEQVWKKEHSLKEIIAPDKFKTHEEIVRRFNMVVNAQEPISDKNEIEFGTRHLDSKSSSSGSFGSISDGVEKFASKSEPKSKDSTNHEDDDFAMYSKLLEG